MDGNIESPSRQLVGMYNIPPTSLKLPDGQSEHPPFHEVLGQPFSDSTTGVYARQQKLSAFMAEAQSDVANHVARVPLNQNSNRKPAPGKKTPQTYESPDRINGRELQNRRRQGEELISRGGWKPEIAELAVEYIQQGAWYDRPSKIWGVRCFVREAEGLGELCKDSKAIRAFLDRNIHKFIAFHAMSKDLEVPDYLVRKADQRRGDWFLKYPWLRSFIREYQGRGRSTTESLVQAYKDQGGGIAANDLTNDVGQGEDSGRKATPVPDAAGMSVSCGHEDIETRRVTLDHTEYGRKRQRGPDRTDDLEIDDLIKRVKRESTEDDVIRSRDRTQGAGTCEVDMGDGNECEGNEAKGMMIHAKGRTLTVLFHGMMSHGGQESDHVQVYVPRTSKGVTINFL